VAAGAALEAAIGEAIAAGEATRDVGGRLGTKAAAEALAARIRAA
jgi:3-isopropylmalate dehydrogenase